MRRFLASHTSLFQRVETLEHNQLLLFDHQSENDRRLGEVFQRLDNSQLTPKEGVFFDGQIFDAYAFASEMYLCRMNKQASIIMAVVTLFAVMAHAQTVYQKDRWGDAVYYFDYEPTIWQIACIILL